MVFVQLPNTKIELLHPLGEKSPIEKFLQKNPSGGMHHICIEVRVLSYDVCSAGVVVKSFARLAIKGYFE